jgi:hypothetical protein
MNAKTLLAAVLIAASLGMSGTSLVRSLSREEKAPTSSPSEAPITPPTATGQPLSPTVIVTTAPRLTVEGFRCSTYKLAFMSYDSRASYSVEELNGWQFVAWYPVELSGGGEVALVCR